MPRLLICFLTGVVLQAEILRANLNGIPFDYGLYSGQELVLAFDHNGNLTIDRDSGEGELNLFLNISGGSMADNYGGIGKLFQGSIRFFVPQETREALWQGAYSLPDQPYYWGGDNQNQLPITLLGEYIDMGALLLGYGSSMHLMGAFYMTQGTLAFNLWQDNSLLGDRGVTSLDAVFSVSPLHSPEPNAFVLIGFGIFLLILYRFIGGFVKEE